MAGPTKTPVDPGIIQRVIQGVRYVITGASDAWYGPNQPLAPVADAPASQTKGRAFDYPVGINLDQKPRIRESNISFDDLRGLADAYDLVRLCIETRKDQMCAQAWDFRLINDDETTDPRLEELKQFFRFPDRVNDWETWLRMIIEDLLVIDAPTLYPRLTRGGQPYAFEPMDGATIKRVIDGYGRTPQAPDPAYQQILHGMNAVDYSVDELIYRPRNLRTSKLYGMSPVEQVITTINVALRRQLNQLSYYTEGNIPDAVFTSPPEWTPDQISQFQDWWDQITANDTKRKGRFIPGGAGFIDTKQALMGPGDQQINEWLARLVCFAFSVTVTGLVSQSNRATSDSQKEQAEDEGLKPMKQWLKNLIDYMVTFYFGYPDIEFNWVVEKEVDALKQAQIAQIYLTTKVVTPDEVRAELGMDPMTPEQLEQLKALQPPPPVMPGQEPKDGAPPSEDTPPSGKGNEPTVKVDVHMPEMKFGDTLVEIGGTVVKVEQADGKVTETRTDGRS